jgi:hypothetical protein
MRRILMNLFQPQCLAPLFVLVACLFHALAALVELRREAAPHIDIGQTAAPDPETPKGQSHDVKSQ